MIKKFYTKREKKHWKYDAKLKQYWSWGFDIQFADGHRKREAGFSSRDQVIVIIGRLKEQELLARHGVQAIGDGARADQAVTVAQLVEVRAQAFDLTNKSQRFSYSVLQEFRDHLPPLTHVRQLTTANLESYVLARRTSRPGLKQSTILRELNTIRAMLHAAGNYFPAFTRWKPPLLPSLLEDERVQSKKKPGPESLLTPTQELALPVIYDANMKDVRAVRRGEKQMAEFPQRIAEMFGQKIEDREIAARLTAEQLKIPFTTYLYKLVSKARSDMRRKRDILEVGEGTIRP